MPVFHTVWHRLYVAVATLSWGGLAGCFAVHAAACYIGLSLAGESDLTGDPAAFFYFYMTTATTVGYGDLSPGTAAGRIVGTLLVLPGSIVLFTAFLGKAIAGMSAFWRRRLQGLGDFSDRRGHTLVVGRQGARTRTRIEGLLRDHRGERIVLLAPAPAENPMPAARDPGASQLATLMFADQRCAADELDWAGIGRAA